jgi:hypothetical protein
MSEKGREVWTRVSWLVIRGGGGNNLRVSSEAWPGGNHTGYQYQ